MRLLLALFACTSPPVPVPEADDVPPSLVSGEYTLDHAGLTRLYRLHVPDEVEIGAPLIVALHGYGTSAETIQGYAGLDALADAEGLVVAYPQSSPDVWGVRCWDIDYCNYDTDPDDLGFLRRVIDTVKGDRGLGRVYVTGMSNGGDMTYRAACEASDIVDAAAPIAGVMMMPLAASCAPPTPPPVLHVHGNADRISLWDGDPAYPGGGYYGAVDSASVFANLHGADDYTTEAQGEGEVVIHRWSTPDRTPVQLYEIDGGGHWWPSSPVDATQTMWDFFTEQTDPT